MSDLEEALEKKDRDFQREAMRDAVFLACTFAHSALATCPRCRVACAIIKDKRLRGIGFNGSVNGVPHCDEVGHNLEEGHCVSTIHAEENAVHNTDREHLKGARAIVTTTPCINCLKTLAQAGVAEVDYYSSYASFGEGKITKLAQQTGISLRRHEVDLQKIFQDLFDLMSLDGGVLKNAGYHLKITKESL